MFNLQCEDCNDYVEMGGSDSLDSARLLTKSTFCECDAKAVQTKVRFFRLPKVPFMLPSFPRTNLRKSVEKNAWTSSPGMRLIFQKDVDITEKRPRMEEESFCRVLSILGILHKYQLTNNL